MVAAARSRRLVRKTYVFPSWETNSILRRRTGCLSTSACCVLMVMIWSRTTPLPRGGRFSSTNEEESFLHARDEADVEQGQLGEPQVVVIPAVEHHDRAWRARRRAS